LCRAKGSKNPPMCSHMFVVASLINFYLLPFLSNKNSFSPIRLIGHFEKLPKTKNIKNANFKSLHLLLTTTTTTKTTTPTTTTPKTTTPTTTTVHQKQQQQKQQQLQQQQQQQKQQQLQQQQQQQQ